LAEPRFEERDWQDFSPGEIVLGRRVEPTLDIDVYEVKLGDEVTKSLSGVSDGHTQMLSTS
jgi:hypothetical protein